MSNAEQVVERPSGSFVSVKTDGFEIQSNTGDANELRQELGLEPKTPDAAPESEEFEAANTQKLPSVAKPRHNPRARRNAIQAEIDAETERKRIAKEAADAEESRLTQLRDEAKKLQTPPPDQTTTPRATSQPSAPTPVSSAASLPAAAVPSQTYDGTDPNDPEPQIAQFATHPSGDPYTAHIYARMDWSARKAARVSQWHTQQQAQFQQADSTYRQRMSGLETKWQDHAKRDPEFTSKIDPEIASALKWSTPTERGTLLGDLVLDSPNTTDLLLYFSEHKSEFGRIMSLVPALQAVELGEIRARLSTKAAEPAPKPRLVSQAKPPIKLPQGGATQPVDDRPDEELTDEEHEAKYAKVRAQYR